MTTIAGRAATIVGVSAAALAIAGCATECYNLVPTPRAGDAPTPVVAQISRVGVTADIGRHGESLGPASHLAIELDVTNVDPSRSATIGRLGLVVHDPRGGPDLFAGPIGRDDTGLVP